MTLRFATPAAFTWRGWLLVAIALLAGLAQQAVAAAFEVRTASLQQRADAWRLTARIDYRLTDKALEALDNGVSLTFSVQVAVYRVRDWLPDSAMFDVTLDRELSFDPLTKRYLVRYGDDRELSSHATLFSALNALGRLQGVPVGAADALDAGQAYTVAVRAVLDQQTLPGPLQVLAFWSGGFSLESDWYEWTMRP